MLRYTLAAAFVFFAIATVYYFSREATHVALRKPLGHTNESSIYWLVVDHGNRGAFRQSISPTEDPLVYQCPIREGDILPVAMFRDATLQHHPYYNPFGDNLLDSGSGWTLEVRGRPSWRAGHAVWNQNPAFRILTTALFFAATLIAYNPRARAIRLPNLCMFLVRVLHFFGRKIGIGKKRPTVHNLENSITSSQKHGGRRWNLHQLSWIC